MDRNEFQAHLAEIAKSINPLEMVTHCQNCQSCSTLLTAVQLSINNHMNEKRR